MFYFSRINLSTECLRENIRIIERSTSMVRLPPAQQEYPSCPLFCSFSRPFKKDVKWETRGLFKNTSRFADWNLSLLSSLSTCADRATTASLTQVSKRPATLLFEKAWHSLPWSLFCLTCLFFNSAVLYSAGHGALLLSSPQVSYAPQNHQSSLWMFAFVPLNFVSLISDSLSLYSTKLLFIRSNFLNPSAL